MKIFPKSAIIPKFIYKIYNMKISLLLIVMFNNCYFL